MRHVLAGILKIIAVTVLLVGVCLYVVANYSELTQELTCKGSLKELGENVVVAEVAEVVHVQLTEYRWWVHLWSENDGYVKTQTEKSASFGYIPFVRKFGQGSLALYEFHDIRNSKPYLRGGYRASNGELTLVFSDNLVFVGTSCRPR